MSATHENPATLESSFAEFIRRIDERARLWMSERGDDDTLLAFASREGAPAATWVNDGHAIVVYASPALGGNERDGLSQMDANKFSVEPAGMTLVNVDLISRRVARLELDADLTHDELRRRLPHGRRPA